MATLSSKKRAVFDIETNGFMPDVSKIWMIVIQDFGTKEIFKFVSKYGIINDVIRSALRVLDEYDVLIGHNIIGYDLVVLKHLCYWEPRPEVTITDTWILSQLIQYKRKHKHGLEGWGEALKKPKVGLDVDFSQYSMLMEQRCVGDVELNTMVYEHLMDVSRKMIQKNPLFLKGIDVEMEFAKIEAEIRTKGWLFDLEAATKLLAEIDGKLTHIEETLEPKIGMRCIKKDGLEAKQPAWRKDGCYTVNTVKWFGYEIESGRRERPIEGPYCRISFEQGKVSSIEVVKDYLYSIGWEPDEWNYEIINRVPVRKSPKLTESSLFLLGDDGRAISEYYTIRSRKGILEGWIKEVEKDGRLHGRMWTIGTPSFRCRHEVVANLPTVDSIYGKEMRSLLLCEEGFSIVGADSAGNQMRGLCHYINNDEFTNEVINGDVHQRNADVLGVPRKTAKPFLYAFLFGGGAGKLGLILTGKRDAAVGQSATDKFKDSIPGFKTLVESIESTFQTTGEQFGKSDAFIKGIDGRLIFSDSKHKLLNYLLQTLEGITCKAAAVWMKRKLVELNIPHYFALHYHDEMAIVVPDEYAEQVRVLSIQAFTDAPKDFGVMCMNGDAKIGKNYAEVH
jgi:DNA polymerase I-like protein with 3'-5' exonuclease and polymerase domains